MYLVDELRELAKAIPKKETVLLPACNPSDFWDSKKETEFEGISISRLLHFVADMYE